MAIQLRRATLGDAETIAAVFSPSFRLLTFLPALHTLAEDRWFIEHIVLRDCEVLLAERDSIAVAFLARQGDEVRLLYVHPYKKNQMIPGT